MHSHSNRHSILTFRHSTTTLGGSGRSKSPWMPKAGSSSVSVLGTATTTPSRHSSALPGSASFSRSLISTECLTHHNVAGICMSLRLATASRSTASTRVSPRPRDVLLRSKRMARASSLSPVRWSGNSRIRRSISSIGRSTLASP